MCKDLPIKRVTSDSFLKRVNDADFSFDDDNNSTNADSVRKQTQRLFEYMINLANINLDESLRVIDLFKISFEIFKKFTSPYYIREAFIEDVEKAFLFIFNEADSTRVSDVTIDEYNTIKGHLQECWERQNVFVWEGEMCKTYSVVSFFCKNYCMLILRENFGNDFFHWNRFSEFGNLVNCLLNLMELEPLAMYLVTMVLSWRRVGV